jgi:hypothetical protein
VKHMHCAGKIVGLNLNYVSELVITAFNKLMHHIHI